MSRKDRWRNLVPAAGPAPAAVAQEAAEDAPASADDAEAEAAGESRPTVNVVRADDTVEAVAGEVIEVPDGADSLGEPMQAVTGDVGGSWNPGAVAADRLRCRVWPCGSLQHDGVTYDAGTVHDFPAALLESLPAGLLTPVE